MNEFDHVAKNLQDEKRVVFTAQSAKNIDKRMLICRHAFDQCVVPINPFTVFGYFLDDLVERDVVRNGNNNLMNRCDELWVYGEISDGVLAEIQMFRKSGKPIRFFDISELPGAVREISKDDAMFADEVKDFSDRI